MIYYLIKFLLFLTGIASLCLIGINDMNISWIKKSVDIIHKKLNSSIISFFKKSIWDIDCWFSGLNILVLWLFLLFCFSISTLIRAGFISILEQSIIPQTITFILSHPKLNLFFIIITIVILLVIAIIFNYIFQFITYLLLFIIMLLYRIKIWLNSINEENKKTLIKYGYYIAAINLFIGFLF